MKRSIETWRNCVPQAMPHLGAMKIGEDIEQQRTPAPKGGGSRQLLADKRYDVCEPIGRA